MRFSDTSVSTNFVKLSLPSAVGSPSLPDKYRHNREMLMLLPPHRERPSSAMYTNITENGQVNDAAKFTSSELVCISSVVTNYDLTFQTEVVCRSHDSGPVTTLYVIQVKTGTNPMNSFTVHSD